MVKDVVPDQLETAITLSPAHDGGVPVDGKAVNAGDEGQDGLPAGSFPVPGSLPRTREWNAGYPA